MNLALGAGESLHFPAIAGLNRLPVSGGTAARVDEWEHFFRDKSARRARTGRRHALLRKIPMLVFLAAILAVAFFAVIGLIELLSASSS